MFDGRDYHRKFEEACVTLAAWTPESEVRSEFDQVEWILWEAIRGVFFLTSAIPAIAIAALLGQLLLQQVGCVWHAVIVLIAASLFATVGYWLLRFVFWAEISRHVQSRKFGD